MSESAEPPAAEQQQTEKPTLDTASSLSYSHRLAHFQSLISNSMVDASPAPTPPVVRRPRVRANSTFIESIKNTFEPERTVKTGRSMSIVGLLPDSGKTKSAKVKESVKILNSNETNLPTPLAVNPPISSAPIEHSSVGSTPRSVPSPSPVSPQSFSFPLPKPRVFVPVSILKPERPAIVEGIVRARLAQFSDSAISSPPSQPQPTNLSSVKPLQMSNYVSSGSVQAARAKYHQLVSQHANPIAAGGQVGKPVNIGHNPNLSARMQAFLTQSNLRYQPTIPSRQALVQAMKEGKDHSHSHAHAANPTAGGRSSLFSIAGLALAAARGVKVPPLNESVDSSSNSPLAGVSAPPLTPEGEFSLQRSALQAAESHQVAEEHRRKLQLVAQRARSRIKNSSIFWTPSSTTVMSSLPPSAAGSFSVNPSTILGWIRESGAAPAEHEIELDNIVVRENIQKSVINEEDEEDEEEEDNNFLLVNDQSKGKRASVKSDSASLIADQPDLESSSESDSLRAVSLTRKKSQRTKLVRFLHQVSVKLFNRTRGGSNSVPRSGAFTLGLDWESAPVYQAPLDPGYGSTNRHKKSAEQKAEEIPHRVYHHYPAANPAEELKRFTEAERQVILESHGENEGEDLEGQELDEIRLSRLSNFCTCKPPPLNVNDEGDIVFESGVNYQCCTDANCPCVRDGIGCHIESDQYCSCFGQYNGPDPDEPTLIRHANRGDGETARACGNSNGCYEFDEYITRQHTMEFIFGEPDSECPSPLSVSVRSEFSSEDHQNSHSPTGSDSGSPSLSSANQNFSFSLSPDANISSRSRHSPPSVGLFRAKLSANHPFLTGGLFNSRSVGSSSSFSIPQNQPDVSLIPASSSGPNSPRAALLARRQNLMRTGTFTGAYSGQTAFSFATENNNQDETAATDHTTEGGAESSEPIAIVNRPIRSGSAVESLSEPTNFSTN